MIPKITFKLNDTNVQQSRSTIYRQYVELTSESKTFPNTTINENITVITIETRLV